MKPVTLRLQKARIGWTVIATIDAISFYHWRPTRKLAENKQDKIVRYNRSQNRPVFVVFRDPS